MSPMEDRITALPDPIICHILSFLPTEQAVATTVLSKRWRPLWLSIPSLTFDDTSYSQNRDTYLRFVQLVYSVFLFRDGEQSIKKFSLNCISSFSNSSIVNTWIMAATQRNVEYLDLLMPRTINLSSRVFNSKTLVVLKLVRGLNVNSSCSFFFPSLKILHLKWVRFHENGYLVEFLSACPVLEVLQIMQLRVTNLLGDFVKKKYLLILGGGQLKQLPKLVKADISMSVLYLPLKSFYNVEFLRIFAELVISRKEFPAHNFINLTYMELIFLNYYWNWLVQLLRHCPILQNLVIDKIEGPKVSDDKNWMHPPFVPECLSSQLKRFCVRGYRGKESEFQFTRYIMLNARVLSNVTICSTSSSNPQEEEKLQMLKQLSLCPRGSDICQLHFE